MTAMPQMVALFNGVGGGAAALDRGLRVPPACAPARGAVDGETMAAIMFTALIGSISFSGA